ncbi:hypothetical protein [Terriglobus sp.]|uniref:hypothetical protein n=1 Tax=Terriglobus sp. TaxID=1889013 RepID=UPI003B0020C5
MTMKQVALGTADTVLIETAPDATGRSVVSGDLALHFSSCTTHIAVNETRIGSTVGFGGIPSVPLSLPIALVLASPDGTRLIGPISGLGQDCKPLPIMPPSITRGMTVDMTKQ